MQGFSRFKAGSFGLCSSKGPFLKNRVEKDQNERRTILEQTSNKVGVNLGFSVKSGLKWTKPDILNFRVWGGVLK